MWGHWDMTTGPDPEMNSVLKKNQHFSMTTPNLVDSEIAVNKKYALKSSTVSYQYWIKY